LDEEGKLKVALNFVRGQNGSILIRINANPRPTESDWKVGGQEPDNIKYIPWPTLKTDGVRLYHFMFLLFLYYYSERQRKVFEG
jgi:hypothetical protein